MDGFTKFCNTWYPLIIPVAAPQRLSVYKSNTRTQLKPILFTEINPVAIRYSLFQEHQAMSLSNHGSLVVTGIVVPRLHHITIQTDAVIQDTPETLLRLIYRGISFAHNINSDVWQSRAARAFLRWREEYGRLWVLLASAMRSHRRQCNI